MLADLADPEAGRSGIALGVLDGAFVFFRAGAELARIVDQIGGLGIVDVEACLQAFAFPLSPSIAASSERRTVMKRSLSVLASREGSRVRKRRVPTERIEAIHRLL